MIDVGQGDSIILSKGNEYAIIDAGPNDNEENIVKYIKNLNIRKFKYIFGTHTHEDHIGAMDKVISNINSEKIIFPKTTSTTKTYENFIDSVIAKNMKLTTPNVSDIYELDGAKIQIIAPNSSLYEEQNNYSICLKVTYNNISCLLMGDAETISEEEILKNGIDVESDVIKIGHHGSSTSTSDKFLDKVNPKYAVISVGKDNSYGHPTMSTLLKLSIRNIEVFRTDKNGTIILETDGENIKWNI